MTVKIKKYKPQDEGKVKKHIISVLKSIYGKTKLDWENFKDYLVLYIAKDNNELIGTAALKKVDKKTVKLKRMYVKTEQQRKGIGTKLLKKILSYAKKNKFKSIILTTYPEMKSGIKFYKKGGFHIVSNPSDKFFTNPSLKKYNARQVAMEKTI